MPSLSRNNICCEGIQPQTTLQNRHEAKYDNVRGQERVDKIKQLTKLVRRQQTAITRFGGAEDYVKASYIIAQDIAKNMKLFSDGDFIKDCIVHAGQCVSLKNC